MKKNPMLRNTIILTVITLVAGLLLGFVHEITAGPIAQQEAETLAAAQRKVFADAASFEPVSENGKAYADLLSGNGITKTTVNSVYRALAEDGTPLGYVVDVTNSEGYGGDIGILAGIRAEGGGTEINGIEFLTLTETAGMGMRAKEPEFMTQFDGLPALQISLDGQDGTAIVDAVSGATITSKGVVKALNAALLAARQEEGL